MPKRGEPFRCGHGTDARGTPFQTCYTCRKPDIDKIAKYRKENNMETTMSLKGGIENSGKGDYIEISNYPKKDGSTRANKLFGLDVSLWKGDGEYNVTLEKNGKGFWTPTNLVLVGSVPAPQGPVSSKMGVHVVSDQTRAIMAQVSLKCAVESEGLRDRVIPVDIFSQDVDKIAHSYMKTLKSLVAGDTPKSDALSDE